MGLSSALGIAQSALANTAAQSAIASRNIGNVSNPDYSRLSPVSLTATDGTVSSALPQRATAAALLANLLDAQSRSTSSQAISDGLAQIASTLGLDLSATNATDAAATDTSPATAIGALANALQQYAAQPDSVSLGAAVVTAAKSLAGSLNAASTNVQAVRATADSEMATSVSTLNGLLARFQVVNTSVVAGLRTGQDVSAAEDQRDGLLKQISQEVGIQTTQSSNGSLSIYTDSGVTLFETNPRTVSFTPTTTYTAGTVGSAVTIDGVPVTGSSAVMPIGTGRLAGLAVLRDQSAVAYQNQLDQVAAGLVNAFAETDQTNGNAPTLPGLFTSSQISGMPTPTNTVGLAATLTVNNRVDPASGGSVSRLRDGNIASDAQAYSYNMGGAAAFSGRISGLVQALNQNRSFDPSSGGTPNASLQAYAQSSVSWIEAQRQTASTNATNASAVASNATTALSNATGVNLDDQMSQMLDIEHAYQASAQLMNSVNAMYSSLLQAFG